MDTDTSQDQGTDSGADIDQLWDDSAAEYYNDRYQKDESTDDSSDKDDTESTDKGTDGASDDGSKDDKGAESKEDEGESESEDDSQVDSEEVQTDSTYREQRAIQREIEANRTEMIRDVGSKLYPDYTPEITDADGDVISTPADVMKHINDATGKPFTPEEAVAWLHAMEAQKRKEHSEMISEVERVSDVNINLRDEIDDIQATYKQLFKDFPELRKEIWDDYKTTLKLDPASGIIIDTPYSVKNFFDRAMKPYMQYAQQLQAQATAKQQKAETQQKQAQRKANRADRADVIPGGNSNVGDDEEDAWADAAREYYEGK